MEDNRPSLDELIAQAEAKKENGEKSISKKTEDVRILVLEK